ncbi:MAG: beta-ketoacyl-ACP synthase [Proteobacteria bacterium]|nr:beta-ketoacyl-ACP synthase [Pseudomonadota bacterium]
MAESEREAWITGLGIVSCLGEGPAAHWDGLAAGRLVVDGTTFAPYIIHPAPRIEFDRQIPKKGDQRQMEQWQRLGVYAAGLALESAGLKGDVERLARVDMIVAAGGGERDYAADAKILSGMPSAENPDIFLNQQLMSEIRPTLFLAQLSNLLAGNISIVHGVTGSSRTFMGEESSGVDAVRIALARIAAGQCEIALVGGAHNAERADTMMLYECGGFNLKAPYRALWERGPDGGFAMGSMGAFLVIENRRHALARGGRPIARLRAAVSARTRRAAAPLDTALTAMWDGIVAPVARADLAIVSGASGAEPATSEERAFLAAHDSVPVRTTAGLFGHGVEAQFAMNMAIAALVIERRQLFASVDRSGVEKPHRGAISRVVVTSVGHSRGEGMAILEAIG